MTRSVVTAGSGSGGGSGSTLSPSTGNWASGTFGSGLIRIHGASNGVYSFTAPTGTTAVRVRCWGAGGGGSQTANYYGGGGGGFSIGEFAVEAGKTYAITVGAGGIANSAGGTSSFGSLISATGGSGSNSGSPQAGGVGVGGYANHSGGSATLSYGGGGGSASLFGNGNDSASAASNQKVSGGAGGGLALSSGVPISTQIHGAVGGLSGSWIKLSDADGGNTNGVRTISTLGSLDMLGTGSGGIGPDYNANGSNGGGGGRLSNGGWPGGGGAVSSRYGADGCVIVEY